MEFVILLNKSYWNEKEKTRLYDQDDIFFLDESKHFEIFYIVSFLPSEIQRITGLEQNLTMPLSHSKQTLNMTLYKK